MGDYIIPASLAHPISQGSDGHYTRIYSRCLFCGDVSNCTLPKPTGLKTRGSRANQKGGSLMITPPKTNSLPLKMDGLEDYVPFGKTYFQGRTAS